MPIYFATAHCKVLEYFLPNVSSFKRLEENVPELLGLSFGEFCLLKTEEEASSAVSWWRDHTDKKHAEQRANVDHFELSRNRTAPHMRACQCMSHFVHDLRSWWLCAIFFFLLGSCALESCSCSALVVCIAIKKLPAGSRDAQFQVIVRARNLTEITADLRT